MNLSDNEVEADAGDTRNKKMCSTEDTIVKLGGEGLTKRELMLFEAKVTGGSLTINYCRNTL